MKRCPECRRDYYDDSLLYCLDDGSALLDGPRSADEAKTAILRSDELIERTPTVRKFDSRSTAGELPEPETERGATSNTSGFRSPTSMPRSFLGAFTSKSKTALVCLIALAVLGGIGFGIYRLGFTKSTRTRPFQNIKLSRATNEGYVDSVAISPDGKYIAYVTAEGASHVLWTKHLATNSRVQIAAQTNAADLYVTGFSPDGNYVFYGVSTSQNSNYDLYQVPVLGGTSRKMLTNIWPAISFAPDGSKIAYGRYDSEEMSVVIANADGTGERALITRKIPEAIGVYSLSWSPDGKTLATGQSGFATSGPSIVAINTVDGVISPLLSRQFLGIGAVRWLSHGEGLVFTGIEQAGDPAQIWYLSYPDGELRRLTNDLNTYLVMSLAPPTADGGSVVAVQEQQTSTISVGAVAGPSSQERVSGGGVANDDVGGLSWDRDGRLFYGTFVENKSEVWMREASGESPRVVMEDKPIGRVTVTPDGRYLVFISERSGTWNLWRTDIDGGNPVQLTSETKAFVIGLSISPDSKWVIYSSVEGDIGRVSIDGGPLTKYITTQVVVQPQLSPNGRYLACVGADPQSSHTQFLIFKIDGDTVMPYKTLELGSALGVVFQWSHDSRSIIYTNTAGRISNLWRQPIDGGKPKQITDFKSEKIADFAFSYDGKQLALASGPVTSDAVLITDVK